MMKTKNALMLKLYVLNTICYNSDMFRSILIILGQLRDISKANIGGILNTLKFCARNVFGYYKISLLRCLTGP